ncbi:MAG: chemotaxis protein CheW [Chloroflexi bacterium]|nr:chemotaxis protein CheW [Chloroflexota bacterium]
MQGTALAIGDEQVVVLELAGEAYGVEIGRVEEIIRMQAITRIPNGPAFIEGVTNLRGRVIPVLDLRKRFGLPATEATRRSRIVVGELGEHTVGLVVDGVSEVLLVGSDAVEPPSTLVTSADSAFLRGVAKLEERLILLLDLSRILTRAEQEDLAA